MKNLAWLAGWCGLAFFLFWLMERGAHTPAKKSRYVTVELTDPVSPDCTGVNGFDTVSRFLLSNSMGDLGGSGGNLFGAERVFRKDLVKRAGHFYIDSVPRASFEYVYVECFSHTILFSTMERDIRLDEKQGDTIPLRLCLLYSGPTATR